MSKLTSFVIAMVVVAGCHKNPNYCPGANPDNNCSEIDAAKDGVTGCTTNAQCSGQPQCATRAPEFITGLAS